ncbi:MAG TPA: amidohydrolase family protein [Longimicrobiales bacterium]
MRITTILATVLALSSAAQAQNAGTYAFTNVNVVPMTSEQVLANQTVVVQNGRIAAVGPAARVRVPNGAQRIDGRGKYLLPGLAEMHGHIPGQNVEFAERVAFLYVAGGVTTVRGMQGHPNQFELRRRIESGELIGPRMILSSPPLSGNTVGDVAAAEAAVRNYKSAGYDLLKIHENLSREVYDRIVATARAVNIPFGGHVPNAVGVHAALDARQTTIDHLDNYVEAMQSESDIPQLVAKTVQSQVALVPTMPLWEVLRGLHDPAAMMQRSELRYMPAQMVAQWQSAVANIRSQANQEQAAREIELRNALLKALSDGGATLLLGSDAPQLFSVPGFSIQREMETWAQIGITPFKILQAGTVAVAKHLNDEANSGTVTVGKRADLLLLDANPLDDVRNIAGKAGVMANGRWLPWSEIQKRLAPN